MQRASLLHRSINVLDRWRRLLCRLSSVSTSRVAAFSNALVLGDSFCECAVRCRYECTLFHSIQDLWNAVSSMMKQVRDRKSGLENLSGDFDLSLFASCKVVKHAPLEAVLAKSKVRVQGPVACKQERRESLRTYSTRDIS